MTRLTRRRPRVGEDVADFGVKRERNDFARGLRFPSAPTQGSISEDFVMDRGESEIRRTPGEILPGGRTKSVLRTGEIDSDESVGLSRQSLSGGELAQLDFLQVKLCINLYSVADKFFGIFSCHSGGEVVNKGCEGFILRVDSKRSRATEERE